MSSLRLLLLNHTRMISQFKYLIRKYDYDVDVTDQDKQTTLITYSTIWVSVSNRDPLIGLFPFDNKATESGLLSLLQLPNQPSTQSAPLSDQLQLIHTSISFLNSSILQVSYCAVTCILPSQKHCQQHPHLEDTALLSHS